MNGEEQTWEIVDINFSMVGRSLKHLNQVIQLYKLYDFFCLSKARYDKFRYNNSEGAMYPGDKNSSDITEMVDESQYTKRKFSLEYFNVRRN